MSALIAVYNSDGCVGRCDAKCYDAQHAECDCICGGVNHGAGLERATENVTHYARAQLEAWAEKSGHDPAELCANRFIPMGRRMIHAGTLARSIVENFRRAGAGRSRTAGARGARNTANRARAHAPLGVSDSGVSPSTQLRRAAAWSAVLCRCSPTADPSRTAGSAAPYSDRSPPCRRAIRPCDYCRACDWCPTCGARGLANEQ